MKISGWNDLSNIMDESKRGEDSFPSNRGNDSRDFGGEASANDRRGKETPKPKRTALQ